mmetsp:Transcript_14071/g.46658  ORF Transcript_14071/g.46658 Transcript_14071/m.46658 type:complete len:230 (-) Transcript_14071:646-1335(-)
MRAPERAGVVHRREGDSGKEHGRRVGRGMGGMMGMMQPLCATRRGAYPGHRAVRHLPLGLPSLEPCRDVFFTHTSRGSQRVSRLNVRRGVSRERGVQNLHLLVAKKRLRVFPRVFFILFLLMNILLNAAQSVTADGRVVPIEIHHRDRPFLGGFRPPSVPRSLRPSFVVEPPPHLFRVQPPVRGPRLVQRGQHRGYLAWSPVFLFLELFKQHPGLRLRKLGADQPAGFR